MSAPCDWDQESYCWEGCGQSATHSRLYTVSEEGHEISLLVCCDHAVDTQQPEGTK